MYTINGNAMSLDRDGNMLMHSGPKSAVRSVRDHKYISKTYKNGKWVYKYERPVGKASKIRATVTRNAGGHYVDKGNAALPEYETWEETYEKQRKENERNEKLKKFTDNFERPDSASDVITSLDPKQALFNFILDKLMSKKKKK